MNFQIIKSVGILVLKACLVALVVIIALKFASPLSLSLNTKNDNMFYVTDEASVYVKPDVASITLGINTTSVGSTSAQSNANQVINRITEDLKKIGVKDENIKTVNYSLYPVYDKDGKRIDYYSANISLSVKEKDLTKVNTIIDTATANGATQVSNISFDVEDRDKAIDDARAQAIKKAKTKAQKIASQSGIKLGRILNVTEYYPNQYDYGLKAGYGGGGGGQTEIQPGQTEIKVNVTLSYDTL